MEISPQTRRFIDAHQDEDVRDVALKAKKTDGLDLPFALDQIAGRQIAKRKLPQWAACNGVIYPPHISMEQCSSQFTAQYKAEIAQRLLDHDALRADGDTPAPGRRETTMIDLTGGFGVDFSYMAHEFDYAIYVERQRHLCELAEHNMRALGLTSVRVVNEEAESYVGALTGARMPFEKERPSCGAGSDDPQSTPPVALIYLDPARRDEHGARTYAIEDCTPNVLALQDRLLSVAPHVMVKLSPMLDWRKAVADFGGTVREVHIVSTGNECKELLLVLGRRGADDSGGTAAIAPHPVHVYCVNDDERLDFAYHDGDAADSPNDPDPRSLGHAPLPEPIRYLYEPNASIMKAGCFGIVEQHYGVTQIGPNSHLFVAAQPVAGFPGRAFHVETITHMGKKELRKALSGLTQANIAVRNFPLNVAQLRKKLRLRDGGDTYLFATTLAGARHVLIRAVKNQAKDQGIR